MSPLTVAAVVVLGALAVGGLGAACWARARRQPEVLEAPQDVVEEVVARSGLRSVRCRCGALVFADRHGQALPHLGCSAEEER